MNVKDVKDTDSPDNVIKAIFDKQWELAQKYRNIEDMGDLLSPKSLTQNIHTANGQKWIKDFAWRVTEEIAESEEAMEMLSTDLPSKDNDDIYLHRMEELADALHFLTELTLIAGYDWKAIEKNVLDNINEESDAWNVVYQLGLMCNCLKNKPWKQTEMLTDRKKFEGYLFGAWIEFLRYFETNLSDDADLFYELYNLYFKKNQVNHFRIRSKY